MTTRTIGLTVGVAALLLVVSRKAAASVQSSTGFLISDAIGALSQGIATAEGFFQTGSAPQLAHNPGALVNGDVGYGRRGLGGITNYGSDDDGWSALRTKLQNIGAGYSSSYWPTMTIAEFARVWTGNDNASAWANTVAGAIGTDSSAMIAPWVTA